MIGAPILPPNPGDIPTASRRGKGRIVAVSLIGGLLCVVLVVVLVVRALDSLGNGIGQAIGDLSTQPAAADALLADETARAHHLRDGALTLAFLNQQRLDVKWLSGEDFVPLNAAKTYVSITVGSEHVLTAANVIGCTYGLTVSTENDPIIRQDHLSGVGTYWAVPEFSQSGAICSANSAPNSGWTRANPETLKRMTAPSST